jgi:hypothetical protein
MTAKNLISGSKTLQKYRFLEIKRFDIDGLNEPDVFV